MMFMISIKNITWVIFFETTTAGTMGKKTQKVVCTALCHVYFCYCKCCVIAEIEDGKAFCVLDCLIKQQVMLNVWLGFRLDICRVTRVSHIEHYLQSTCKELFEFSLKVTILFLCKMKLYLRTFQIAKSICISLYSANTVIYFASIVFH